MGKANILIVEDDRIVAEGIKISLEGLGYSVFAIVSSGEDALHKIKEGIPDLVLMDIKIEGAMDGIETAAQIRSRFDVPIVYLTAYDSPDILARVKKTEPFGYIVKPFEDRELNVAVDIGIYKHKMEKELRQSKEWFNTTLKSIGDAVIATDQKGHIKFMNSVAQSKTHWKISDAIGKPIQEIFKVFDKESGELIKSPVEKIIKEGQKIDVSNYFVLTQNEKAYPVEAVLITKNAKKIDVEDSLAPLKDEKGNILGTVLIFQDVSERRKIEKTLKENEEKFRSVFENSPLGMIHFDKFGVVTACNENLCKMLGSTKDKLIGLDTTKSLKDVEMLNSISKALSGKKSLYEGEYLSVTGRVRTQVRARYAPIISNGGEVTGALGIFEDITEQLSAEQEKRNLEIQLQQVQKMESIGKLAGGIAHDFNNVLYPIIGFTQMSMEDLPKVHPVQENLQDILSGAKRARDLVKQILLFSRQKEQFLKPTILKPIIEEALNLLRVTIPANIDIEANLYDGKDYVLSDETEIHEIVMNLCTNAYHSMELNGGKIKISLDNTQPGSDLNMPPGDYICLSVSDTGMGIADDIKDKIFEPYYTTKGIGKGTGLGLSVVHGIVKNYKGGIHVESRHKKGTTFNIFLPIAKNTIAVEDEQEKENRLFGTERILFVDDEKPIVKLGIRSLERMGYAVTGILNSSEALTLFESQPNDFDLVITDMAMPGMEGTKLAQKILEIRPDIPIILCSGFSNKIDKEKAKKLNIRSFIDKPILLDALATEVRKIFDEIGRGKNA